ncbi:hypothetical protein ABZP36_007020 [Zizania latifolia]
MAEMIRAITGAGYLRRRRRRLQRRSGGRGRKMRNRPIGYNRLPEPLRLICLSVAASAPSSSPPRRTPAPRLLLSHTAAAPFIPDRRQRATP